MPNDKGAGRPAGSTNKKLKMIGKQPPTIFDDKPEETEYQCYSCGLTRNFKFLYCPDCGKLNEWGD